MKPISFGQPLPKKTETEVLRPLSSRSKNEEKPFQSVYSRPASAFKTHQTPLKSPVRTF